MDAPALFDRIVVSSLEGVAGGKMKLAELRDDTKIGRGITDILQDLKMRGIVSWRGELTSETEVSLSCS